MLQAFLFLPKSSDLNNKIERFRNKTAKLDRSPEVCLKRLGP